MNRHEIILIVVSVLGSACGVGIPLISLLWKAFGLIANIRLELSTLHSRNEFLKRDLEDAEEKWGAIHNQTLQRIDHASTRLREDVNRLHAQVRELQNYLAKTTDFEVRN